MCVMSCVTWHDHAYVHLYCKSANVPGSDRGYSGSVPEVYWANHHSSSWPVQMNLHTLSCINFMNVNAYKNVK